MKLRRRKGWVRRLWYNLDGFLPRKLRPCRCLSYHKRTGRHGDVCSRGQGDHPFTERNVRRAWRIVRTGW